MSSDENIFVQDIGFLQFLSNSVESVESGQGFMVVHSGMFDHDPVILFIDHQRCKGHGHLFSHGCRRMGAFEQTCFGSRSQSR